MILLNSTNRLSIDLHITNKWNVSGHPSKPLQILEGCSWLNEWSIKYVPDSVDDIIVIFRSPMKFSWKVHTIFAAAYGCFRGKCLLRMFRTVVWPIQLIVCCMVSWSMRTVMCNRRRWRKRNQWKQSFCYTCRFRTSEPLKQKSECKNACEYVAKLLTKEEYNTDFQETHMEE